MDSIRPNSKNRSAAAARGDLVRVENKALNSAGVLEWATNARSLASAWLLVLLSALPSLATAAPAWIKLTSPAQNSYTVPVSYEIVASSGNGTSGSSVESIENITIYRNDQPVASYRRGGILVEAGLAPGTYTYRATGKAVSIYQGEDRTRNLATQPFTITVNPPPALYNEAEFVSQTFSDTSPTMYSGETRTLSVQMRNTGTTTWSSSRAYALGSQNPRDNGNWGMGRVYLPHDVAPGQTVAFNMTLTAPQVSSRMVGYYVQWRMVQDGVEWFGQQTTAQHVYVNPVPSGSLSAQPNPCELSKGATSCGTTLSWQAVAGLPELWRSDINGNGAVRLLAQPGTGEIKTSISDITESGSRFEVRGDGRVLASVDVYARRPQPVITGNIDGFTADGSALLGWACATTYQAPVNVQMYVGGPAGATGSALIGTYPANQASEAGVAVACKVDGGNYRFAIPISNELRSQYAGRLVYVYGVSPVGGENLAVAASGRFGVPAPQVPVTQPNTRRYVYDAQQRLCKVIEPETGATVTDYDGEGNVAWSASGLNLPATDNCNRSEAAASGRVVSRTYDARNRLKDLAFPDGRGNQRWEYTPDGLASKVVTYNEPDNGAPVENHYSYNKRRLLIGEAVAQPGSHRWDLGYGYDRIGNPASQVYPTGLAVTFEPDALGQPKRVSSPGAVYASQIDYYPNGGMQRFVYGNGVVHTMSQNLRQLPQRSTDAGVIDLETVYDANGNVGAIYDRARGDNYSRTMEYDGLDRLKSAGSCSFGGDCWHRFSYDAQDNLRSWILPGVKDYAAYVYDQKSRLTNIRNTAGESVVGIGYDDQGNVDNKNGQAYVFDLGNRLRKVVGKESYVYDAHGRRVASLRDESDPRLLSLYSYGGLPLYTEEPQKQLRTVNIYLRGSLLASHANDGIRYQHTDALGSPVAASDEAGGVVARTLYDPFGSVIGSAVYDGIGFAGHIADGPTGLVQMQQRYMDPDVGRFLSVDPLGVDARLGNGFNRYSYAVNNPYRFTDPDGRCERTTGSMICRRTAAPGVGSGAVGGRVAGEAAKKGAGILAGMLSAPVLATVVGVGAAVYSADLGQEREDPSYILFHGTTVEHALAFLGGAPLSIDIAKSASNHSGSAPGFYMARTDWMAESFGMYTGKPYTVLRYTIRRSAMQELKATGARFQPIPNGRLRGNLGDEFYVPPMAFPLFNSLREMGDIRVAPHKVGN
ncbi:RHS repeat-associated core domain-containing protein [Lysobacter firmicutimachus]|uniref:RHS repeat-associated core domain-containing protein n=1 Tax=Lysobacter firmicutimachus TaxID=1792846 RepID=A0AAU8MP82_9GAMM